MEQRGFQPFSERTEKGHHGLLERVSWAQLTVCLWHKTKVVLAAQF